MRTVHPSHGIDNGQIGVRKDNDIDGHTTCWSWKCWCGEWYDGYSSRLEARNEYNEHKKTCIWVKRRKPQVDKNAEMYWKEHRKKTYEWYLLGDE